MTLEEKKSQLRGEIIDALENEDDDLAYDLMDDLVRIEEDSENLEEDE